VSLYDDAVTIAKGYIGPVGQQFLDRQLTSHLNIKPTDLASGHLGELAKWCFASGKLVIDPNQATEFSDKIKALAR
jgi:hypothetical protein